MQNDAHLKAPFTLALGGGGARGLAHIGVLRALESYGLMPSLIVGSSMGAIIGAMYSQLRDALHVQELIEEMLYRDCFTNLRLDLMRENARSKEPISRKHLHDYLKLGLYFSHAVTKAGAIDSSILIHLLSRLLRNEDIKKTQISFAAVAVSILTGEEKLLTSGSIIRAVAASSAIPGMITPVEINGDMLVDGSVLQTVPVRAAKSISANPIVAVDVSKDIIHEALPKTGLDIIVRASIIANRKLTQESLKDANMVMAPDVSHVDWSDFHSIDQLVKAGENEAKVKLNKPDYANISLPRNYANDIPHDTNSSLANSNYFLVQ
ncbi:MAG: patatin-like phospholipase family protein [Candidatus Kryptoniota bacterium]